ncbi:MAG: aminotransferase class I/II-fold pyridoxal phosphate-dependent enzyme [Sulfitobacter litoralis]|jgi:aspartate/methionine/tyrosine aminotransferase|uniref:Aminotransferase n=2 Tax=root TaxID=1 RepID=A0A1H0T8S1_9RHOB|nr:MULTISPECIES: aminotransferase class I/II-fold pyridoxal phosphate-dependent enzyme [Sulfitobacter]MBQ0715621.1 aminotransferase class I/II-fold pyridoxal phosphate-dependent enzyme [Sulfitobacter litoralis]MBQ0766989.1 aminotransferase class I/II-fold pyridoxal phosphate-dependent enzyme [Sulfitobacter litoralis]MBQ0801150.1 aminotransferase class I/II-fold pyridoxal phosphate-dependent enzyme [Sulfitobacter litoralis]MCF7726022.1 aminotransferase class I/II-fold pyridoxal phosphate-depende|tara:strand:+ start:1302 stop:2444 length:1143 start_codon:yes stop_codon:yes gene_type:complete
MRNSTRSQVDPFIVMDVMQAAAAAEAEGHHIIHMEVGQPGTGAPKGASAALTAAMEQGALGYTVALGLPALRKRIALMYAEWYNVDLDPSRVVITSGSSGGFILTFTSLFDTGDRVGIGAPGYPSYRQILKALDLTPVDLPTSIENRLQPVPSDFADMDLQGLLVASPGNPTGTMLDHGAMSALIDATQGQGASFISDEIYHGIEYEKKAVTALEISNDAYVINSFSKYFSMTGWRVGWMVVPEDHVRVVERIAQNMFICAPHASQVAALAAMDCTAELEANMDVYRANRAMMITGLRDAGFTSFAPPDGAFYVYADVSSLTTDSRELARDILDKAGVAVTPGLDFDPVRGHQTLRFSYARSTQDIAEGLGRLKAYMAAR